MYCPNGIASESEWGMLNNYTWTVGITGKLGLKFSLVLSSLVT